MFGIDLKLILGGIIVVLLILLGISHAEYNHELKLRMQVEANFNAFSEGVKADGIKAEEEKKKLVDLHEANLKTVKDKYEAKTTEIQSNAVANYVAAHPAARVRKCPGTNPGSSDLSANTVGQPVDDGAKQELIPVEQGFIRECASDASKLGAWQLYCKLNACPVEE